MRYLPLLVLLAISIYSFQIQGQAKTISDDQFSANTTKFNNIPLKRLKIKYPDSAILKQSDFRDYARCLLGDMYIETYIEAIKGKLIIYKDPEMIKSYSQRAVKNFFSIRIGKLIKSKWTPDTSLAAAARAFGVNIGDPTIFGFLKIESIKDSIGYDSIQNDVLGFSCDIPDIPVFYIRGSSFAKFASADQLYTLHQLITFEPSSNIRQNSVKINDKRIMEYFGLLLNNINNGFYKAVMDKKVTPYLKYDESIVKDSIEGVKGRTMSCETVSIQLDPNDPNKTQDSTVCRSFMDIPDHVKMAIKLMWKVNGSIVSIEPMLNFTYGNDNDNYTQMFLLRFRDALPLLSQEEQLWIENVLNYKLKWLSGQ